MPFSSTSKILAFSTLGFNFPGLVNKTKGEPPRGPFAVRPVWHFIQCCLKIATTLSSDSSFSLMVSTGFGGFGGAVNICGWTTFNSGCPSGGGTSGASRLIKTGSPPLAVHRALKTSSETFSEMKRTEPSAITTFVPRLPSREVLTKGRMLPVSGTPTTLLPPPAIQARL